jgi:hypothetical protein
MMGVNGWRSKCDYDGKKIERREQVRRVLGEWGGSASRVCFSKENHPPRSLARKRGGGGGKFKPTNQNGVTFHDDCHMDTTATPRVHPKKFLFKLSQYPVVSTSAWERIG